MANNRNVHDGHRKRLDGRATSSGMEFLEEHEQLEKILFCVIPRANTNGIAHELLNRFGTLSAVLTASPKELQEIKGVGVRAAEFLTTLPCVLGIVERCFKKSRNKLTSAKEIGEFAASLFYGKLYESVYVIFLDRRDGVITFEKASDGTIDASSVYITPIVKSAIRNKAASIILTHNHPSGDCRPSDSDDKVTKQLGKSLETVNIKLKDHIIVGTEEFYSYKEATDSGFAVFGFEMNFYDRLNENSKPDQNTYSEK